MSVATFDVEDGVATITINRPEARNALSPELLVRLRALWIRVADDASIRVVILTGAGTDAFCAGGDLKLLTPLLSGARQPEDAFDEAVLADTRLAGEATLRDFDPGKPIIAAINGDAVAAGMEMLHGTDIRIASSHARLGVREVRHGLVAHGGSCVRLPRQIPQVHAMEMLMTGQLYDAGHLLRIGYVNHVVQPDDLLPRARAIAARIAANAPLAVALTRRIVRETMGLADEAAALRREWELGTTIHATEDAREGARAFADKRAPVFRGR